MNRLIWAPALCLALGAAGVVRAAPQVEADPNRDDSITPEAGPWVICAAYFTGPAAPDLARQMAYLIRSKYNMNAYVFNYADEERKKQQAAFDRQRPALPADAPADGSDVVVPIPRHHTVVHVEEQCAVLIGGYADENAAHKALLDVKKWPTPELKAPDGVLPFGYIIDHGKEKPMNPFALQSMVVRNPAVPQENQADRKRKDPFLKTLNADEEYSMLNCQGRYTLAVTEYVGASSVKPQQMQMELGGFLKTLGLGTSHEGESLAVAANNAHELAKALQKAGFQPYVLHTRTSSVVSIGAFNAEDDRNMETVKAQFATWQRQLAAAQKDPTKTNPLGLFPAPVAIEVPHP